MEKILAQKPHRILLSYIGLTLLQNKYPEEYENIFYNLMTITDDEYTAAMVGRYRDIATLVISINKKQLELGFIPQMGGARKTRRRRYRKRTIRKNKRCGRQRTRKQRY
jgi:hypothetical protein